MNLDKYTEQKEKFHGECKVCKKTFFSQETWSKHFKTVHAHGKGISLRDRART